MCGTGPWRPAPPTAGCLVGAITATSATTARQATAPTAIRTTITTAIGGRGALYIK